MILWMLYLVIKGFADIPGEAPSPATAGWSPDANRHHPPRRVPATETRLGGGGQAPRR